MGISVGVILTNHKLKSMHVSFSYWGYLPTNINGVFKVKCLRSIKTVIFLIPHNILHKFCKLIFTKLIINMQYLAALPISTWLNQPDHEAPMSTQVNVCDYLNTWLKNICTLTGALKVQNVVIITLRCLVLTELSFALYTSGI